LLSVVWLRGYSLAITRSHLVIRSRRDPASGHPYRHRFAPSTCIPRIRGRVMLLKGVGYCAAMGRRGDLSKGGWGEYTSGWTRVDLFLGTASRLFPPSLRNQAVHHVSPFFASFSWQSRSQTGNTYRMIQKRHRKGEPAPFDESRDFVDTLFLAPNRSDSRGNFESSANLSDETLCLD